MRRNRGNTVLSLFSTIHGLRAMFSGPRKAQALRCGVKGLFQNFPLLGQKLFLICTRKSARQETGQHFGDKALPARFFLAYENGICLLYTSFISMQAKYLFGAFWGALPEGFSYSEYARQGFFELCRVAAINIVILLAANVMSRAQAAENCLLRVCNTALSALTLLLLATAAAKMALYIAAYGLTVKRVLAKMCIRDRSWMALMISLVNFSPSTYTML